MTRTVLHFAQDSDTSGFFPQLATCHDRGRFRMVFGTLRSMDPRLREHMETHGVECLDCGRSSRASYPAGLASVVRFLRRRQIDVLHAHLFDPSVVGLMAAVLARTPSRVLTRHHSDYHTRINRPVHVAIDRLCTRMSHRVIAVSQHTADHLVQIENAPPAKVRVIHNGIDFDRVRVSSPEAPGRRREELAVAGRPIVLIAARLHPEKGYEPLLQAFAEVLKRVPAAVLLIAGTGPLENHYRRLAALHSLGDSVRFLGFRHDLPDLISAAEVVVLPSLAEAFGLAAAEALYLGTPVVASRVGGLPEIVDDDVDGLLVSPNQPPALAEALVRVLTQPDLRARLAGSGRQKVKERFSFQAMVREYERVYDELDARAT